MTHTIKERMLLFNKTTTFPLTIFKNSKFYHCIGLEKQKAENIYTQIKLNGESEKFHNHTFDNNINYLQLNGQNNKNELTIVVGPFGFDITKDNDNFFDTIKNTKSSCFQVMKHNSVVQIYKLLELLFCDEDLIFNDIDKNLSPLNTLEHNMIEYREIDFFHHTYYMEKKLLDNVFKNNNGSIGDMIKKYSSFHGKTSKNDIYQIKNMSIAAITLISRTAIEQGLSPHYAFTISDNYIRKIGEEINLANLDIIMQDCFRTLQQYIKISTNSIHSKKIRVAIRLIEKELSKNITLSKIAKSIEISPSHLSRQFKEETKVTFSEFVLNMRLEESKKLLQFSDFSINEITEMIGFKSKSYFTKCFREKYKQTPMAFRLFLKSNVMNE